MAAAGRKTSGRGGEGAGAVAPDSKLADALAAASWSEADQALAEALLEFAGLRRAAADKLTGKAVEALEMSGQALAQAARRRGLSLFGEVGATIPFDPKAHDLGRSAPAWNVRVVREGVMRGTDVLIRAVVAPERKTAKKS